MADQLTLKYQFYSYWHTGGGKGAGAGADAIVERTKESLPYIGGKTIKGLYRDCVNRMEQWGHFDKELIKHNTNKQDTENETLTDFLFGKILRTNNEDRHNFQDGLLRFSDANLAPDVRDWLIATDKSAGNYAARESLYTTLHSTEIDIEKGTAVNHSLRSREVVVPLTLYSSIHLLDSDTDKNERAAALDWQSVLSRCAPLLRQIGSVRNRGFGRVHVTEKAAGSL